MEEVIWRKSLECFGLKRVTGALNFFINRLTSRKSNFIGKIKRGHSVTNNQVEVKEEVAKNFFEGVVLKHYAATGGSSISPYFSQL